MRVTKTAVEEFFKSALWQDIADALCYGIDTGRHELEDISLSEIETAVLRGKLWQLHNIVDHLEGSLMESLEAESEEQESEDDN